MHKFKVGDRVKRNPEVRQWDGKLRPQIGTVTIRTVDNIYYVEWDRKPYIPHSIPGSWYMEDELLLVQKGVNTLGNFPKNKEA